MSDRELLELAAKANGDPLIRRVGDQWERVIGYSEQLVCDVSCCWNPLLDDGDALRLAVNLHFAIYRSFKGITVEFQGCYFDEPPGQDSYAATRRAIVRAAAELGQLP